MSKSCDCCDKECSFCADRKIDRIILTIKQGGNQKIITKEFGGKSVRSIFGEDGKYNFKFGENLRTYRREQNSSGVCVTNLDYYRKFYVEINFLTNEICNDVYFSYPDAEKDSKKIIVKEQNILKIFFEDEQDADTIELRYRGTYERISFEIPSFCPNNSLSAISNHISSQLFYTHNDFRGPQESLLNVTVQRPIINSEGSLGMDYGYTIKSYLKGFFVDKTLEPYGTCQPTEPKILTDPGSQFVINPSEENLTGKVVTFFDIVGGDCTLISDCVNKCITSEINFNVYNSTETILDEYEIDIYDKVPYYFSYFNSGISNIFEEKADNDFIGGPVTSTPCFSSEYVQCGTERVCNTSIINGQPINCYDRPKYCLTGFGCARRNRIHASNYFVEKYNKIIIKDKIPCCNSQNNFFKKIERPFTAYAPYSNYFNGGYVDIDSKTAKNYKILNGPIDSFEYTLYNELDQFYANYHYSSLYGKQRRIIVGCGECHESVTFYNNDYYYLSGFKILSNNSYDIEYKLEVIYSNSNDTKECSGDLIKLRIANKENYQDIKISKFKISCGTGNNLIIELDNTGNSFETIIGEKFGSVIPDISGYSKSFINKSCDVIGNISRSGNFTGEIFNLRQDYTTTDQIRFGIYPLELCYVSLSNFQNLLIPKAATLIDFTNVNDCNPYFLMPAIELSCCPKLSYRYLTRTEFNIDFQYKITPNENGLLLSLSFTQKFLNPFGYLGGRFFLSSKTYSCSEIPLTSNFSQLFGLGLPVFGITPLPLEREIFMPIYETPFIYKGEYQISYINDLHTPKALNLFNLPVDFDHNNFGFLNTVTVEAF